MMQFSHVVLKNIMNICSWKSIQQNVDVPFDDFVGFKLELHILVKRHLSHFQTPSIVFTNTMFVKRYDYKVYIA